MVKITYADKNEGVDCNLVDKTVTVPCAREISTLNFFSGFSLVLAVAILGFYYLIKEKRE